MDKYDTVRRSSRKEMALRGPGVQLVFLHVDFGVATAFGAPPATRSTDRTSRIELTSRCEAMQCQQRVQRKAAVAAMPNARALVEMHCLALTAPVVPEEYMSVYTCDASSASSTTAA
jgi:hypothetical protein